MKRILGFSVLILLALLIAGCSSKSSGPVTFTIEMTEYAFEPSLIEVRVGQEVTLELVNNGQLIHEIMIGRDVMMMNNRPSGYQVDMFETAGVEPEVVVLEEHAHEGEEHEMEHAGFMVVVTENGGKSNMTFTVTEDMLGEWEIGCFEQDGVHYDAGMKGKFVVKQ